MISINQTGGGNLVIGDIMFSANISSISSTSNKTQYVYDALGRIVSVINPDGTIKNTTYNKSIINDYDENRNRHTYILDAYDRIIEVKEYNTDFYIKDNQTYNTTYSYNGADELLGIRDNEGNNFNFTYNSLGQKIQLDDPDLGTWKYGYDFAGNLISQTGGGGNLVTGDNYYREYNGLGQLQRVRDGNNASANILEEYFYDSNGDRIKISRYSYEGGTNETIYTPYREWMQIKNSSGTFNFYYIYQGDTLVAKLNADGTKYYYHADHLGSTSLITDENGNVVEQEFFSPYGESLSENDAEENKLYTGQFKDSIECQYYYGARYYNPCNPPIFIQPDLIVQAPYNPQSLNKYSYVGNNPYKFVDPTGKMHRSPGSRTSGGSSVTATPVYRIIVEDSAGYTVYRRQIAYYEVTYRTGGGGGGNVKIAPNAYQSLQSQAYQQSQTAYSRFFSLGRNMQQEYMASYLEALQGRSYDPRSGLQRTIQNRVFQTSASITGGLFTYGIGGAGVAGAFELGNLEEKKALQGELELNDYGEAYADMIIAGVGGKAVKTAAYGVTAKIGTDGTKNIIIDIASEIGADIIYEKGKESTE